VSGRLAYHDILRLLETSVIPFILPDAPEQAPMIEAKVIVDRVLSIIVWSRYLCEGTSKMIW